MNDRHAVRTFAVLVMAGLLSGCAALTVSVDVYKGPLANDEHVLTEQTAVMAIGAKPLLKQLRCELLQPDGEDRKQIHQDPECDMPIGAMPLLQQSRCKSLQSAKKKADAAGNRKDNQTPRDPECDVDLETVSWERKERAKRVEAVSTLYEDQLDSVPGLSRYFSVAHMKQEEFEMALKTLQGDRKEEESLWERVKPPSGKESAEVLQQLFREFQIESENQPKVKAERKQLINAVKEVMVIPEDDYRLVRNLLHAYVRLDRLLRPPIEEGVGRTIFQGVWPVRAEQDILPYDGQTTTAYALLAQEEVQHHLTRMLFGVEDSDRTEAFMKHLAIIASSFLDTRQALRDLWIESILFLGFLNDPLTNDKNLQWIEAIEAARPRLTLAIAPLIAALTDVQDIAVTVCLRDTAATACFDDPPPPLPEKDIGKLREYLVEQSRPEVWTICPGEENCDFKADWNPSRLRKARRALEFAIIARPKEMGDLLLRSDEIFRQIPYTEFKWLPDNEDASVKKIGNIGYAQFQLDADYREGDYRWEYYCPEDLRESMKAACQKTRDFGITEVRRRGLRLQETLQQNIAVVEEAGGVGLGRGRLPQGLDTLIEEYIEAVADKKQDVKDIEFKRRRLLNALVRFAEKVLVIANHQELLDPSENDPPGNDDLNKYVVTLQAIGNAIIVQVDDLIRRQSHRTDLERRVDVLDNMIAHLRYELIRAQRDGDQNSANQIQQALDSAYDHRAGMAFIRPSSAFLRSSYAGTGLQDDPGLAWRNMLREHARRAWRNKEDEPPSRVIEETDKQFWQNINKVRVDGGGNTNYVLAKDDVGNWYVKSYSTDRTAIFQSARNLALFGAGAALDLNLMERMVLEQEFQEKGSGLDGDKKKRLDELRGEQAKAGTPAALSGVYDKYRAQYNDMTAKTHARLKKELAPSSEDADTKDTELGARILAAWSKQPALTAHLEHLREALLARSDAMGQRHDEMVKLEVEQGEDGQPLSPDVKAQRQAAQIIDALRSVADFEDGLVSVIDQTGQLATYLTNAVQEKEKAEEEYKKAKQEREGLEKQLAEKKVEIENKRMGVSSIGGDTEETQNRKKEALEALDQEESQIEKQLNGRIEEAKRTEGGRKTAFDEATKAHDAVRQAQQLAKATVAGIAGALFREVLEARQQTVREYETAITYVGDLSSD